MTVIIEEINVDKPWSFIWLMYVRDVDLKKHCKPCLKGYSSKKINKKTRHEVNVVLDESEAKYYYLCGGSLPYKWEDNFHLAWEEKEGESFEYSFNGITIKLKNASLHCKINQIKEHTSCHRVENAEAFVSISLGLRRYTCGCLL